jgi:uncharacterized paraquat-inducible protein A
MNLIACPQCGTANDDPEGQRSGEAFCSECDYPLFFVLGVVQRIDLDDDSAQSRLPGVGGRDRRVWQPCPECGELNPRDGVHCLRCGAVLAKPEPELVTVEQPIVEPEPEPEPPTHEWRCPRLPWATVGFLVGVALTLVTVALEWIG